MMRQQEYRGRAGAMVALTVGVAGIAVMPVFGPVAWLIARKELAAAAAGRRPPEIVGFARSARILGIIGTVLLATVSILFLFAVAGIIRVD